MRLSPATFGELPAVYAHLQLNFIHDEIRDFDDFIRVCGNGKFTVYHIEEDGERRGFITVWELEGTTFLEHFVIYEEFRNNGCGGRALETLKERYAELVLEAELPVEPVQIRRIGFYERHGFCLNAREYFQPPYRRGGAACPMKLLSYPNQLRDFDKTVKLIYNEVYSVTDGRL